MAYSYGYPSDRYGEPIFVRIDEARDWHTEVMVGKIMQVRKHPTQDKYHLMVNEYNDSVYEHKRNVKFTNGTSECGRYNYAHLYIWARYCTPITSNKLVKGVLDKI